LIAADAAPAAHAPTAVAIHDVPMPPTLVPAPRPTSAPSAPKESQGPTLPSPSPAAAAGAYRDGEYTGPVVDAYFGNVQVKAVIRGGQIADVTFLDYPHHRRTSVRINDYAMPYLTTEAIQAQSARVDVISGATLTSEAFAESLQSALGQAKS
jgi:uncharacterized protein with FMN-binding domain